MVGTIHTNGEGPDHYVWELSKADLVFRGAKGDECLSCKVDQGERIIRFTIYPYAPENQSPYFEPLRQGEKFGARSIDTFATTVPVWDLDCGMEALLSTRNQEPFKIKDTTGKDVGSLVIKITDTQPPAEYQMR